MDIKQKLEEGYLLGYIKYKENCVAYFMPIAYWILNYEKYDPSYNPNNWKFIFRDNILTVMDYNIEKYLSAIEVDKISMEEVRKNKNINVTFYIDFDNKLFVSSFNDIEVEEYLPDGNWKGLYGNTQEYLPLQCGGIPPL